MCRIVCSNSCDKSEKHFCLLQHMFLSPLVIILRAQWSCITKKKKKLFRLSILLIQTQSAYKNYRSSFLKDLRASDYGVATYVWNHNVNKIIDATLHKSNLTFLKLGFFKQTQKEDLRKTKKQETTRKREEYTPANKIRKERHQLKN